VMRHVGDGLFIHRSYPPIRRTNEIGERALSPTPVRYSIMAESPML
jgi:hypothetical protein